MTTDEFWLARCKLDLHPKVYCECEMDKQKKLARSDSEKEIQTLLAKQNRLENALREIAVCDHWLGRIAKKALHDGVE